MSLGKNVLVIPAKELSDIRSAIDRASRNIDALKVFLPNRELTAKTGDLAIVETQADGRTYDVVISVAEPSCDLRMAVGDVLHGLRTALDHLTYCLALRNGFPLTGNRSPEQLRRLRKLSFLIHDDPHRFQSAAGNVSPLIGARPVEEMEKLQTYNDTDPRGLTLWRLSELDNIAKHRTISAIAQQLDRAEVAVTLGDQTFAGTC